MVKAFIAAASPALAGACHDRNPAMAGYRPLPHDNRLRPGFQRMLSAQRGDAARKTQAILTAAG
jgi:hypothetical protein